MATRLNLLAADRILADTAPMIAPADALRKLREGNRRFADGDTDSIARTSVRADLVDGQTPFAIILACSDSRVPVEMVFDCGLGDLFVIRVAGNIVAPSQIGSIEFAAEQFGTRLVVVLGHTNCGAVTATLNELALNDSHRSPNLRAIVDRVRPSVEPVVEKYRDGGDAALLGEAIRANIRGSVQRLSHGSEILEKLIEDNELVVVGAEYSIETGNVEFFDGNAV